MTGRTARVWRWFRTPSAGLASGTLLVLGAVAALTAWGGFTAFVAYSNSPAFCISCHEMRDTVYVEYQKSTHYRRSSGVRATCADCHVPRDFGPKMAAKMRATWNELPKHLLGTYDTVEKFEARRPELVRHVWEQMKANDSRECRGCHNRDAMDLAAQKPRARGQHEDALKSGETCIDCHKGIAHEVPASLREAEKEEPEEEDFSL